MVDGFPRPSLFSCRACGVKFVDCELHVRHETGCPPGAAAEHAELGTSSPFAVAASGLVLLAIALAV